MNFHAKFLCSLVEIVHTNQGQTYQIILLFILLLHGIQDGIVFSFRKKEVYFLFSVGKYFEVV